MMSANVPCSYDDVDIVQMRCILSKMNRSDQTCCFTAARFAIYVRINLDLNNPYNRKWIPRG